MKLLPFVLACALVPSLASANPKKEAKRHLAAAAQAHKEGRHEDVLAELEKAYALDPRPALHYSIGQTYVKLDRCEDAIGAYERFLAAKPPAAQADLANQAIATCQQQLAAKSAATAAAATTPEAMTSSDDDVPPGMPAASVVAPVEPTTPTTDDRRAWYTDKLGLGLAGGGVVVTVVGLVLYGGARAKIDDAESAGSYGESSDLYADARGQRTLSVIFIAGGVAALGVGGWRLWQQRSAERDDIAIAPTTTGAVITWSGNF